MNAPDWSTLTLGAAVRASAARYPATVAIVDGERRTTFRDLDGQADALALGLRELGIARGDQVAVWLTNCTEWVTCWIACARLGAVLVPINTRFKTDEVRYILEQSEARALVLMDTCWNIDYLGMARELMPRLPALRSVIVWKDVQASGMLNLQAVMAQGAALLAQGATLPQAHAGDPVVIVYTSGTTGHPKGAMHGHVFLRNAANVARCMHVEPHDVVLGHMPFYHVAGCIATVGMCLLVGCTLVTLPQWVVGEALDVIERERVTIFGGIPTHFVDCLDEIRRRPRDTTCLKCAWIGGAPVTPDVALAAKQELHIQGLLASYGMTETTASTTLSEFDAPLEVLCDNKGKPVGEFEVAVCDVLTGQPLPVGETGEVRVRGHIVMLGYYKNPAATAETMTPDGWFRTGDLGAFDADGYLKVTGRLKDMFIVGGSNAYPAEIERMLQSHPKVKQAVVVGVPDRRLGEVGMAFVQLHEAGGDEAGLAAELTAFCRQHMADYKVPRRIRVVADFPRTPTGKIQRFVVAREAREAAPVAAAA